MSGNSTNLQLPYLSPAQAQKHVTVNESLRRLDALVQLAVVSATITAQPASPADGAVYILPAGKSGAAWGAMTTGALAYYRDGAWEQIVPREGWRAYVQDSEQLQVYTGTVWSQTAARSSLGLGTAATYNVGTSGANVPLLNAANTFSADLAFSGYRNISLPTGNSSGYVSGRYDWANRFHDHMLLSCNYVPDVNGVGFAGGWIPRVELGTALIEVRGSVASPGLIGFWIGAVNTAPSRRVIVTNDQLSPETDNSMVLGRSNGRWSTVYAATGSINTSDAREKTTITPLGEALSRVAARIKASIGTFQWLEAVERKGADRARIHIGVTAQAVEAAFEAEGLDASRYALFCEDALTEEVEIEPARINESGEIESPGRYETRPMLEPDGTPRTRKGVRADQLFWLLLAAGGP